MPRACLPLTALVLAATPAWAQGTASGESDPAFSDARPLTVEESAALSAALDFDPTQAAAKPAKALKATGRQPDPFAITRATAADGSTVYTLKRVLPTLGAKVGADLGAAPAPDPYYDPDRPFRRPAGNTGAAWASFDVMRGASIDARIDPRADQGRLATTLRHSMPVGSQLSLTLQNTTGLTDSLGTPAATVPGGLPMRALPQADGADPNQVWDEQPSLKLDVLSTGTSFSAGLARSSNDPVTHNRIGAEQTLYGPLHVSTSITDIGEESENRSITAGFKFRW